MDDHDKPAHHDPHATDTADEERREDEQDVATEPLEDGSGKTPDVPMDSEASDGKVGEAPSTPWEDTGEDKR